MPTTDKIFISYSRHDEAFARKLAVWLNKTLNIGIWIDVDDIQPGVKWSAAIQDGLDNCEVMVVIITPESMESINVEDEWQYFLDQGKPVVPILLRTAPIPYQLRRIQYIDFSLPEDAANSQRQLIVELRQHLNPMPTEGESKLAHSHQTGTTGARPTASKRAVQNKEKLKQSEHLLKEHEKALKQSNNLTMILVGILLLVVIGFGVMFYVFLTRDIRVFVVDTGNGTAVAFVPGASQALAINGTAELPIGSRIVAENAPVRFSIEGSGAQGVLLPDSSATVTENNDNGLNVDLVDGSVSMDGAGNSGSVTTQYGIQIDARESVDVQIDQENSMIRTTCYEGSCSITEPTTGRTRELEEGNAIVFSGDNSDFDTAPLLPIPGAIAYVSYKHGAPEIYLMDADGQNQTRMTNNTYNDFSPSWSPDGSRIAIETYGRDNADIATISPEGGNVIYLTGPEGNDRSPAWSPNGAYIAFISNRDGNDDIYIMQPDGSDIRRITENANPSNGITWSPDSTQIAFSSRSAGNGDIFTLAISGEEEPRNLTMNDAPDTTPAWSPDGTRMAFTSQRERAGNSEVYVMVIETGEIINVSNDPDFDADPSWSPDSRQLVFTSQRDGFKDVFIVPADNSSEPVNISNLARVDDQSPVWLHQLRAGQTN